MVTSQSGTISERRHTRGLGLMLAARASRRRSLVTSLPGRVAGRMMKQYSPEMRRWLNVVPQLDCLTSHWVIVLVFQHCRSIKLRYSPMPALRLS